jgi:aspartate/methionine/tyrosine aminotransferase
MRTDIVHIGAGELTYEIRGIMEVVEKLNAMGMKITLENIGDPVAKGEEIPDWLKSIIADLAMENGSYAYSATLGDLETRKYLAALTNQTSGVHLDENDILFFNGLGDAITKVYGFLRRTARVITPSPTYTTHSSSEAAHAGLPPVCYPLDPRNHWYPDVAELRRRVKYNPAIAAILIINPDNPTGMVYHRGRNLLESGIQRSQRQIPVRDCRKRAGHQHERHFQRASLAGKSLWMDGSL